MSVLWLLAPATWITLGIVCWISWQLLRQNGRILLRIEELERALYELQFEETGGAIASARAEAENEPRAARFSRGTLARSRINRGGLTAGTLAPSFSLPRLDGGKLSLEDFRKQRILLVFSDPHCSPCNALAPELEKFHRENPGIHLVMIGRGEPDENRAKVKEHGLTFPLVLQRSWEISRLYAMFTTPMAYLIDEQGVILNDPAVGVKPILNLMAEAKESTQQKTLADLALDRASEMC